MAQCHFIFSTNQPKCPLPPRHHLLHVEALVALGSRVQKLFFSDVAANSFSIHLKLLLKQKTQCNSQYVSQRLYWGEKNNWYDWYLRIMHCDFFAMLTNTLATVNRCVAENQSSVGVLLNLRHGRNCPCRVNLSCVLGGRAERGEGNLQ